MSRQTRRVSMSRPASCRSGSGTRGIGGRTHHPAPVQTSSTSACAIDAAAASSSASSFASSSSACASDGRDGCAPMPHGRAKRRFGAAVYRGSEVAAGEGSGVEWFLLETTRPKEYLTAGASSLPSFARPVLAPCTVSRPPLVAHDEQGGTGAARERAPFAWTLGQDHVPLGQEESSGPLRQGASLGHGRGCVLAGPRAWADGARPVGDWRRGAASRSSTASA